MSSGIGLHIGENKEHGIGFLIPGEIIKIGVLMVDIIHVIGPVAFRIGKKDQNTVWGH